MLKITTSLLLLLASTSISYAQESATINKGKLDSIIEVIGAKDKAMLSIALMQDGKQVYSKSVGYADLSTSNKIPATADTKYRIGSISKVFTGTMIFQLIEEGKLSLTTPLSSFFPGVTNAEKITIANLLDHSSGLFNFTSDPDYTKKINTKVTQTEQLAQFQHTASFEPGTKHQYSNTNFVLLGFIIEKLDKTSYASSVKKRITSKLGLKNTYYGTKINTANKEANSYKWAGKWIADTETDMSIPGGAGAMVSTPGDLVTFFHALFNGKLISLASLEKMKTIKEGYGMAMFISPFYDKKAYGHNGGIDGFQSNALYFPEEKLALAYVSNGVNMAMNDVSIAALSVAFNKPYVIPNFKEIALTTTDLDQYLGTYSTDKMPLKITITKKDTVLYAQATGQSAFPLVAAEPHVFTFSAAGITLTFDVDKNQMTLKQGAGLYVMSKEKS